MILSSNSNTCIQWWIDNLPNSYKPIELPDPDRKIESDSSGFGWGCHDITNDVKCSGLWSEDEKQHHINYLELKAAFLALKNVCINVTNEHVYLYLDNTTAIKYISNMGGRKTRLNELTRELWLWCADRNIWISCFYIPGRLNRTADRLSRKLSEDMEWSICDEIFAAIASKYGECDIDLFASYKNHKLPRYCSYLPDDKAFAVNAFSLKWNDYFSYIFCPFSMIGPVLQKLSQDKAEAVIVAPIFSTQPWFPLLLKMICRQSYILPQTSEILYQRRSSNKHRLTKMRLGVFRISGNNLSCQVYQKTLPVSSFQPGGKLHKNNMGRILKDGVSFVVDKKLISFTHL